MSTATVEDLYAELKKDGEKAGYFLNPDQAFVRELLDGLLVNEERFGYRACPCRLATGEKAEDLDIICPCDYRDPDLVDHGACYCALYVSQEVLEGRLKLRPIPERRVPQERRQTPKLKDLASQLAYPVWRCKVCGYLCAREKPPALCPICKAQAERFERFL
ncbi:MAG: ferredoxin-thioredoxin reductase catalytic domain-containing protein [Syntrophaceae bacterium]